MTADELIGSAPELIKFNREGLFIFAVRVMLGAGSFGDPPTVI